jgi:hypothetical protein
MGFDLGLCVYIRTIRALWFSSVQQYHYFGHLYTTKIAETALKASLIYSMDGLIDMNEWMNYNQYFVYIYSSIS